MHTPVFRCPSAVCCQSKWPSVLTLFLSSTLKKKKKRFDQPAISAVHDLYLPVVNSLHESASAIFLPGHLGREGEEKHTHTHTHKHKTSVNVAPVAEVNGLLSHVFFFFLRFIAKKKKHPFPERKKKLFFFFPQCLFAVAVFFFFLIVVVNSHALRYENT